MNNFRLGIGLMRLWFVSSVIYMGAVVYMGAGAVRAEFAKPSVAPIVTSPTINQIPIFCDQARGVKGQDFNSLREVEKDPLGLKPVLRGNGSSSERPICVYKIEKFRSLYPEYEGVNDIQLDRMASEKTLGFKTIFDFRGDDSFVPPKPWVMLRELAWRAFCYPLAGLLVLLSACWIWRGFLEQRSTAKHP